MNTGSNSMIKKLSFMSEIRQFGTTKVLQYQNSNV